MPAPSETASARNTSRGSTAASSTICVPRSRWRLVGLISHHRLAAHGYAERQKHELVGYGYLYFCIDGIQVVIHFQGRIGGLRCACRTDCQIWRWRTGGINTEYVDCAPLYVASGHKPLNVALNLRG